MNEPHERYTKIPNYILDHSLSKLDKGPLKVYLYLARRTIGFHKHADAISLSQFCGGIKTREGKRMDSGTGLKRDTVIAALRILEVSGFITKTKGHGRRANIYEIVDLDS